MNVQVNGLVETYEPGLTLKGLLAAKNINPNTVACELNMTVVRRANLDAAVLKDGDVVEIIRMIGGG